MSFIYFFFILRHIPLGEEDVSERLHGPSCWLGLNHDSSPAQAGELRGDCHLGGNPLARDTGGDGTKVMPAALLCASQGC